MSSLPDFVLHAPWWIAGAIILFGILLFLSGNKRVDKALQRLGMVVVLIGVLLTVLHLTFPSDRERMEKRTRQIVAAIDHKNWKQLASCLDSNTFLAALNYDRTMNGRDSIVALTQRESDAVGLHSLTITGLQSRQDDSLITVAVDVLSTQEGTFDRPIPSSAQFDFEQSDDGWVLRKITVIKIYDQENVNLGLK